MISPELLKRYSFFGAFSEEQLRKICSIAEEINIEMGAIIFNECAPANTLYLLLDGSIDLYYKSEEEYHPKTSKEFYVGEINPGEVFAISSLVEPYVLNASGRISKKSRYVSIDAIKFREMFKQDPNMGYIALQQVTKVIMERLAYTRVQLAAAWA